MEAGTPNPRKGNLQIAGTARNKDALPFLCILWSPLLIIDFVALFNPGFERVIIFNILYLFLTARYFVLLSCQVEDGKLTFRWPLRKVTITSSNLRYVKYEDLWPGGINVRGGLHIPFGLSLQRWSNAAILIEELSDICDRNPGAMKNPREVRSFLRRARKFKANQPQ